MPDYPLVPLAKVAAFAGGVGFPHAEQGRTEGDYPFFKVSDMNAPGNERDMVSAENWIDEEQRARLRARVWPAGTVIFPKVGAALKTEKRRLLTRPSCFDNNVMGLVPTAEVLPRYLLAVMEGVRFSALAQEGVVPSINQRLVGSIAIPLPPVEVQATVVSVLVAADEVTDAARAHASEAAAMRDALSRALTARDYELGVSQPEAPETA